MWNWFDHAVKELQGSTDDGRFFLQPWKWLYRLLALLFAVGAVVLPLATLSGGTRATYVLHQNEMHSASAQTLSTTVLLALALSIIGILAARLMWGRSDGLAHFRGIGQRFSIGPLMADLIRTIGELGGIVSAVAAVLLFLVLWPAEQAVVQIPVVGDLLRQYMSVPLWFPLVAILAGFANLLLTRWIAEYMEVFFTMANDVRGLRNGADAVQLLERDAAPDRMPLVVNWSMVGIAFLSYLTIALPLHSGWPLMPATMLLLFFGLKRWWPGASLLLSFIIMLGVGIVTAWIGNANPGSLIEHFHDAWIKLLLALFLVGLVSICVSLHELISGPLGDWEAAYGKVSLVTLVTIFMVFPTWHTWKEFRARHTLTMEEHGAARDLFKEYQDKTYAFHLGTRVDTVNLIRVSAAQYSADKYGKISFSHTLTSHGVERTAQFERSYRNIRIPDSVSYRSQFGEWTVSYFKDSLVIRDKRQGYVGHALPVEMIRDRTYGTARRLRSEAVRDSLHQLRDTLQGVFKAYNCDAPPCFAWFEVEQESGGPKRMAFYTRGSVVSSYPLGSIPADDSKWRLKVRKTIVENADASDEASIVVELVGLDAVVEETSEPKSTQDEIGRSVPKPNDKVVLTPAKAAADKQERMEKKPLRKEDVDIEPSFVGGRTGLDRYIKTNRRYPAEDLAAGRTGKVRVSFVVEKGGTVRDVRCVRSVSPSLDAEAIRLIRGMPNWAPGMKGGVAVEVLMEWTVDFSLND